VREKRPRASFSLMRSGRSEARMVLDGARPAAADRWDLPGGVTALEASEPKCDNPGVSRARDQAAKAATAIWRQKLTSGEIDIPLRQ
jgi:hypothetical protein